MPQEASALSMGPALSPTSFMTWSILLKGETANWNSVLQKEENAHTPLPRYLVTIATLRKIVITSRNPLHTIMSSDIKKMKSPIILSEE
jgi:hypothetical protein